MSSIVSCSKSRSVSIELTIYVYLFGMQWRNFSIEGASP
jgi:hypothetical protein